MSAAAGRSASWIGVLVVVGAALAPLGSSRDPVLVGALCDAAHFPLFGLLAVLLFHGLPNGRRRFVPRLVRTAAVGVALAFGVELGQNFTGRTPSLTDLLNGTLGIGAALWGLDLWRNRAAAAARLAHVVVCAAVCVALSAPAWLAWRAALWRLDHFPLLGEFENEIELRLWQTRDGDAARSALSLVDEHVTTSGGHALRVATAAGSWAGVDYAGGGLDWRPYGELVWELYNPGEPFRLGLRVEGRARRDYEAGFNSRFEVVHGWNRFRVPLDRIRDEPQAGPLELGAIEALMLFTGHDEPARVFELDDVRLEGHAADRSEPR